MQDQEIKHPVLLSFPPVLDYQLCLNYFFFPPEKVYSNTCCLVQGESATTDIYMQRCASAKQNGMQLEPQHKQRKKQQIHTSIFLISCGKLLLKNMVHVIFTEGSLEKSFCTHALDILISEAVRDVPKKNLKSHIYISTYSFFPPIFFF